jgi:hypothetical protein
MGGGVVNIERIAQHVVGRALADMVGELQDKIEAAELAAESMKFFMDDAGRLFVYRLARVAQLLAEARSNAKVL